MSIEDEMAGRLERMVSDGVDILKISKEALDIYQDPNFLLTEKLNIALLSLVVMVEGPEFEMPKISFMNFYLALHRCKLFNMSILAK